MKRELVKTNGITLIALVITIIVMLILAGVTINLTMGESGIFIKAKEAKIKMEIAMIKEQIQMDILAEKLENNGNISEDRLKEILIEYGTLSESEEKLIDKILTTTNGSHEIKVSDIFRDTTYDNTAGDDTREATASIIAENPSSYYGSVVNYEVSDSNIQTTLESEGIQWKIFNADNENIYLIASDYIPLELVPPSGNNSIKKMWGAYAGNFYNIINDYSGKSDLISSPASKWINNLNDITYPETNSIKATAYMMDTDLWSCFGRTKL